MALADVSTSPVHANVTSTMTLADFLTYDDGTDAVYELEDGELRRMPTESEINCLIVSFLFSYFVQVGIPFSRLRTKTEVAVSGLQATVRLPDFMILTHEQVEALRGAPRSLITLDMPPPRLVVEVVSPGQENIDRDYRYKRSQYESRGIPEYWIVDPLLEQVTVLSWVKGLYDAAVFQGTDPIQSGLLQELGQGSLLTVEQILKAGA
ncbi:MAG: Uma2 family endonuclease [Thermostichus sp. DG02_5_bins_236]